MGALHRLDAQLFGEGKLAIEELTLKEIQVQLEKLQVPGKDLVECDRPLKVCIGSFVGTFEAFARVAETRVRDALTAADMVLV